MLRQFYPNCADKIASRRSDPPRRRGAYFSDQIQIFAVKQAGPQHISADKSRFRAKMASAAPGFRPDPFRMNSNAPEPARPSLVGHPPINASSIALTGSRCTRAPATTTTESTSPTDTPFNRGISKGNPLENRIPCRMARKFPVVRCRGLRFSRFQEKSAHKEGGRKSP